MYPEFKWKPRKLNNEKLKNPGIFSWQLLVERCNPLLVIWHGKWKETTVHRDLLHLKRHEQQQKVIYRVIFKNPALISRPGKGFRHIEKDRPASLKLLSCISVFLILIILASFDPKCQQAWRYLYFYVIGDFQCHHSNTLIRLSSN